MTHASNRDGSRPFHYNCAEPGSRRLPEPNRKFVEATEHEPVAVCPSQVVAVDSEFEVGKAPEQRAERDACLEAR